MHRNTFLFPFLDKSSNIITKSHWNIKESSLGYESMKGEA